MKIGFIGTGWIGKNYALDFTERGYDVTSYSLEPEYKKNKDKISKCDIVFIAVPTPTTPKGFDDSIIRSVLGLVGKGKIAVLKSTIVPGKTKELQKKFPNITLLYSPEFLSEATAKFDTSNPFSSIVGFSKETKIQKEACQKVLSILPKAPFSLVSSSTEAEIIKYTHNTSGFVQIIFFNMIYDLSRKLGCNWKTIHKAIIADPFMSHKYAQPIHKSGRGAGGHCFIKDFEAFHRLYEKLFSNDKSGSAIFRENIKKNIELLTRTKKDLGLLRGVYGDDIIKK